MREEKERNQRNFLLGKYSIPVGDDDDDDVTP